MQKSADYPKDIPEQEIAFRSFRKTILEKYEGELEQLQADREAGRAVGQRMNKQTEEFFKKSNLDLTGRDTLIKSEKEEMKRYLAQVRSQFIKREPQRDVRLREEAEQALSYIQSGWSQAYLVGADVLAGTPELLKKYEGERGNPTIWLYDANKQWKGEAHSQGTGPCLGGWEYCPGGTIWYYTWPATGPGKFSINSVLFYHGFHVLYAIPLPPYYCAWAAIKATVKLEVYRQVGYPKYSQFLGNDEKTIIDEESYAGISNGVDAGPAILSTDVNITSAGLVYMAVTLSLQAAARDYVAFSEINFQDGEANYIIPPFTAIAPIP